MKRTILSMMIAAVFLVMNTVMAQTFTYPVNGKQGFSLSEKTRDGLHVSYNLGQFTLSQLNYRGESMSEISISGMVLPNTEGCPNLPVESRMLAIPQGANARLNVINVESEIVRDVDIAPALRIQAENEEPQFNYVKNRDIYEKNAFYPEQPFTIDRSSIRGVDVVAVSVSPFQYNPVTKELKVYSNIELSVSFEGGNGHFGDDRLRSPYWDPILASQLMNYDQLPVIDYAARMQQWLRDGADGAEYVIVTPNNDGWAEYANQLKDYRTRQGILTKVYRLDEMPASTTDEMKAWFHNAYNTWTIPPVAVLLFGDHNSNMAEGIPAEYTYHSSSYGNCITDNGYADVTGDNLPDIVFSRLVAANPTEAQMMASKQIEYEYTNPNMDANSYDHPITALGWQTERWFQICSEVVGGYWRNQGKHPVRINEIYDGTPGSIWSSNQNTDIVVSYFGPNGLGYLPASPDELGGWTGGTGSQVVDAVNNGCMLLQHRDHGYEQGWGEPDFSNNNVAQMNNVGKLTFVNTINCQTGMFDYSSNCLIEAFMRRTYDGQNAGAVGCLGPTQTSYSFVNDTYVWGLYDQYDPNFLPDYGPFANYQGNWQPAFGNVAGKYFLQQSSWPYNSSSKAITYKMFTAHCDAFLRLYTQVPQMMNVTHSSTVVAGYGAITASAPAGCMISLVKANIDGGWDILAVAEATGSSQVIQFEPQVPPIVINIVVTGHDYLRYEDTIEVIPAEGSYLVVDSYSPNATPVNQQTSLSMSFRNVGLDATTGTTTVTLTSQDNRLTITDGTGQFGALGSNQVVTLANEFSFIIAQDVPDNTRFTLNVTMTCGADTWTGVATIMATQAVLEYVGMSWAGSFEPGETLTLTAMFKNTGHYQATNAVARMTSSSNYINITNPTVNVGTIAVDQEVSCQFNVTIATNTPETAQIPVTFTMTANGDLSAQGNETLKNACNVIFDLHDSYSGNDGWNGAILVVSFDDGTPSENLTIENGSNSATYTLEIGNGTHVTLTWSSGSYDGECSFTVSYEGNLVFYEMAANSNPSAGVLYEFDCNCAAASQIFTVTATSSNTTQGTVSGGGEYNFGQSCTVTATPADGYIFTGWTQDGIAISGAASYTFNVTSDMNLVAHFAEGIMIGDGGEATNNYLPAFSYYTHSLTQQIYTSAELGDAGVITSIAFYNGGAKKTLDYDFYLKSTTKSTFSDNTDWITVSNSDKVFSGSVVMAANAWTTIPLSTPFVYDGTSNVVLVTNKNTSWTNSPHMSCRVFDATNQAMYVYSDNTEYNPLAPPTSYGSNDHYAVLSQKNQLLISKGASSTEPIHITVSINPELAGTVSGGGEYNAGETCTIIATPNEGYSFVNWTQNGTEVSTETTYTFTVTEDAEFVANFSLNSYQVTAIAAPVEGGIVTFGGNSSTNGFFFDFENGFGDWTTIDADGDGYSWFTLSDLPNYTNNYGTDLSGWANNGSNAVLSGSFINGMSVTTDPDNFLVSPLVNLGGSISFYAKGLDANYPEHFGVAVSTESNPSASSFVTLAEWNTETDREYHLYTVDLSAYTGLGYIAIRDFNVHDMYIVVVDDVTIVEGYTNVWSGIYHFGESCTLTATANQGYTFINWTKDGSEVSTETSYSFTVTEDAALVANFSLDSYQVTATPSSVEGGSVTVSSNRNRDELFYDFEDGTAQGWTTLQGPNSDSPNNWMHCASYLEDYSTSHGHNASNGFMLSESYVIDDDETGSVHPDNYLVSPRILLGGSVTFWATNVESGYAEHFAVAVSTNGNTDANDFTNIQEWTLAAKAQRTGNTRSLENGTWYEYTVDLSEYVGWGYVAIHHFDCYDQWLLCVDDITIVEGEPYTGAVSGIFNHGESCTVTATANEGYAFVNWTENEEIVSTDAAYTFTVTGERDLIANFEEVITTVTQTSEFGAGWNWWTPNVDLNGAELLSQLKQGLGANGISITDQSGASLTYHSTYGWGGMISSLQVGKMYQIQIGTACTVTLNGPAVNPADHSITLTYGPNWIGFYGTQSMSVNAALANLNATAGDVIYAQDGTSATYSATFGWGGFLQTLVPGQAYIYNSKASQSKTFTFPTSAK